MWGQGQCTLCGLRKLWSLGLKKRLYDFEFVPGKEGLKRSLSPFADDLWAKQINWNEFVSKPRAATTEMLDAVNHDAGNEEWVQACKVSRENVLVRKQGCLVEYIDVLEERLLKHLPHRVLHEQVKRSQSDWERERRPFMFARNIDFSENGSIENFRILQSDHWTSLQYTLFISVWDWLSAAAWDLDSGHIDNGTAVTVHGEKSGQNVNLDSFYGEIVCRRQDKDACLSDSGPAYEVLDRSGKRHWVGRKDLRVRSVISVACTGISDDRRHDRAQQQHFTRRELVWMEEHLHLHHPEDIPRGKIWSLHQHSDNAAQHFKNTGALRWFTDLGVAQGIAAGALDRGSTSFSFTWTFGAPGHGKGVWDGLGGTFKSMVRRQIERCQQSDSGENLPGLSTNVIASAEDVFKVVEAVFDSDTWRDTARANGRVIKRMKFFLSSSKKTTTHPKGYLPVAADRPITKETFITLENISISYQFICTRRDWVHVRCRPCWCLGCVKSFNEGTNKCMDEFTPVSCTSGKRSKDNFTCKLRTCRKLTGPSLAKSLKQISDNLKKDAMNLTVGDWVLFSAPVANDRPLWVGRMAANPEWLGAPIWVNKSLRKRVFKDDKITIMPGGVALFVQWYDQLGLPSTTSVRFRKCIEYPEPELQSMKLLVIAKFNKLMPQMEGTVEPTMQTRTNPSNPFATTAERSASAVAAREFAMSADHYTQALALIDGWASS